MAVQIEIQADNEAGDRASEKADEKAPVLPIAAGDWVAHAADHAYARVGRVKASYWAGEPGGQVLMDVAIHELSGNRLGRESPSMGGPRTFEPATPFDGYWRRIHPPRFPVKAVFTSVPSEGRPGWFSLVNTPWHPDGLRSKPVRTVAHGVRRRRIALPSPDATPANGSDVEIASLRRAAQELRGAARGLPGSAAQTLLARADELDAEATRLQRIEL